MKNRLKLPENKANLGFLVVLLITLVVFSSSITNDFVNWDDPHNVLENESIKSLSFRSVKNIFTQHLQGKYHRVSPLAHLTFAIEYNSFGAQPFIFHLTNLFLHLCNTISVFLLIYALTLNNRTAFIVGILFGIHPIHVEPVVWISSRMHLLCAFFYLNALLFYTLDKTPKISAVRRSVLLIIFLFSLLSNGSAVTLPLILLAIDYFRNKKITLRDVKDKSPLFILSLVFGILSVYAANFSLNYQDPYITNQTLSFLNRILLSCYALFFSAGKLVWPVALSCVYPLSIYLRENLFIFPFILAGILFVVFFQKRTPQSLFLRFGTLFFLITLAPFLHMYGVSDSIIGDRYLYIPSIGIFLIMAFLINRLFKAKFFNTKMEKLSLAAGTTFYIIFLCVLSMQQIGVWKNSETLWTDVIKKYPFAHFAYNSRGSFYFQNGKFMPALSDFSKLIILTPNDSEAYLNHANTLARLGFVKGAIASYTKTIELAPKPSAYVNRGNMLFLTGAHLEALEDYDKSIQMDSGQASAYFNRAMLFKKLNNYPKALEDLNRVLYITPENSIARRIKLQIEAERN